MKFFEKWFPIVISMLAITISLGTFLQSRKDFNALNRPQLIMKPIKYENGSYLKFTSDSLLYNIQFLIEIKNNGMLTAEGINLKKNFT